MAQQFRVWSGSEEFKFGEPHGSLEEARDFARYWMDPRPRYGSRVVIKDEETNERIETIMTWANGTFKYSIEDPSGDWRKRTIEFTDKDGNCVEAQFHSESEKEYFNSTYKLSGDIYVPRK